MVWLYSLDIYDLIKERYFKSLKRDYIIVVKII